MSEDIHFLRENSVEESYLLHVDSRDRDRTVWPTPGQFRLNFDSPFKNVYSLDVLDAQIPRTQYTINENSDTLVVTPPDGVPRVLRIQNGSHTDTTILDSLNTELNPIGITASFESAPTNLRLKLKFTCARRFSFDMAASTINRVIGFDQLSYNHSKQGISFYGDESEPRRFASMITDPVQSIIYSWLATDFSPEVAAPPTPATRYYAMRLESDQASGVLKTIQVAARTTDDFAWRIATSGSTGPSTTTPIASGVAHAISPGGFATISFNARTSPYLDQSSLYWLVLDFAATTNLPLIATSAPDIPAYSVISSPDQTTWSPLPDDHALMVARVDLTLGSQALVAPGMYDLTGIPYVFLRIPEIESHLYRSRAYEAYNMPIAKFKMSIVGYSDTRLDFATLQPRPFHPIGKLTCLTFQFWGSDGHLYDFMGVNASFTMVIRYLVPKQRLPFDNKRLNPHYEPDTTVQPHEENSEDESTDFQSSDEEDGEEFVRVSYGD